MTSHISIKKKITHNGKTGVVQAGVAPWGLWVWSDWNHATQEQTFSDEECNGAIKQTYFADGASVQRENWEWDPETGMPKAYDDGAPNMTLKHVQGSMEVSKKVTKSLAELENTLFYSWVHYACGVNTTFSLQRLSECGGHS